MSGGSVGNREKPQVGVSDRVEPAPLPSPAPEEPSGPDTGPMDGGRIGSATAREHSRIPLEIRDFFGSPYSQTLLVRGPPGSGKTTFVLEALREFPGRRIFASSRVEISRLLQYYPWLKEKDSAIQAVPIDSGEQGIDWVAEALTRLRLFRPGQAATHPSVENRWTWLPPAIQEVWRSIGPGEPTMMVIDSWDALVEAYVGDEGGSAEGIPKRDELERILLRCAGLLNAHLALVVERSADSRIERQLDFMVDGIIDLSKPTVEGRIERWLHIPKHRGVRIQEADYPFTLNDGRFTSAEAVDLSQTLPDPPEHDPHPEANSIWPGSEMFAETFGRLATGRVSTVEVGPSVPAEAISVMLTPIVESNLQRGGRVFLATPPTLNIERVWGVMRNRMPLHRFLDGVRIFVAGRPAKVPSELDSLLIELPHAGSADANPIQRSVEFLGNGTTPGGTPGVAIAWHAALEAMAGASGVDYNPITAPQLAQRYLSSGDVHLLVIGHNGNREFQALGDMSAVEIRVRERQGRLFLAGVRPRTPILILQAGTHGSPYSLLPLV
jgi:hypothetical protein